MKHGKALGVERTALVEGLTMMDDLPFRIDRMSELLELAQRSEHSDFERAAVHGAAWAVARGLFERIEVANGINRNQAREALRQWRNYVSAMVGYADPRGEETSTLFNWGVGSTKAFRAAVLPYDQAEIAETAGGVQRGDDGGY